MSKIRLFKGDCLKLMKDLPDKSVDLILCDLPYQITQNKWDTIIPFAELWSQYDRIAKTNTPTILFGQGVFSINLIMSNIKDYRYSLIWDKVLSSGFLNANRMPLRQHEDIHLFYKKLPYYSPQKTKGEFCHGKGKAVGKKNDGGNNYGSGITVETEGNMKHPTSILTFSKSHPSKMLHPTEKPIKLLEFLIKSYSKENDLVLDNCMGSGSTGVACYNTNRDFIGMELNNDYFDVATNRIREIQTQNKLGVT